MSRLQTGAPCLGTLIISLVSATGAHAEESLSPRERALQLIDACQFAKPPQIAEGMFSNQAEMAEMGNRVRAYAASMQQSLSCLDEAHEAVAPSQRDFLTYIYNNGVDQLNFVVSEYNQQVRQHRQLGGFTNP
jgi:hypothetical protein